MITTPWSRLRRWQGWRALSVFTNPRMAILSASRIQKTRRRLLTTTKRVCVIWKTISGSTKLPLTLRRASTRLFFMQNHSCFFLSPGLVLISLYTFPVCGCVFSKGIILLPIFKSPCPAVANFRYSVCEADRL